MIAPFIFAVAPYTVPIALALATWLAVEAVFGFATLCVYLWKKG